MARDAAEAPAGRRVGCELRYAADGPATFLFAVQPARGGSGARQRVASERLAVTAAGGAVEPESWDAAPGGTRWLRLAAAVPGEVVLSYEAEVAPDPLLHDPAGVSEIPVRDLPREALPYLLPSRYCESDRLEGFARAQFGHLALGHARVAAVCSWVHDRTLYQRGASDARTTALDTLTDARGVCRDFAHLGVALTRALGVPARFLAAYAPHLVPADFHAAFEALLLGPDGPRWYAFDATRQTALDGLVRIAVGADASTTAFASLWGAARPLEGPEAMRVRCDPPPGGDDAERTVAAVSVSDA